MNGNGIAVHGEPRYYPGDLLPASQWTWRRPSPGSPVPRDPVVRSAERTVALFFTGSYLAGSSHLPLAADARSEDRDGHNDRT